MNSKKQKDISSYFIPSKRLKCNTDENVSKQSTHDNSNLNNNSELENNEKEVPAVVSSLSTNHCSNSDIRLSVNDDDIGLYVSKALSSNDFSLLIRLLTKPWAPGSTYVFPKLEQNGRTLSVCQHSWLAKYPWLSYSKIHQGVYCRYCVLFSRQGDSRKWLGQFVNKPLRSLKDAMIYLSNHEKCDYHKLSISQATECIARFTHSNSDVHALLNNADLQQQNENRLILHSLIKCILFLSKQNIAFRGRDDDGMPDRDNASQGNFKSLVSFRAEAGDQTLQTHLQRYRKNATYMSPSIQNALISICASFVRKNLLKEIINQNKFYAIIADETSDVSGTEQLSISIRYVSEENDIGIKEYYLGLAALSDPTAAGITQSIATFIKNCGLKIENIRGIFLGNGFFKTN